MYLEERVEALERENIQLQQEIENLKRYGLTEYVTVAQLAERMQCSRSTIHKKIKDGEIIATYKLGDARIPMSQFTDIRAQEKAREAVSETPKRRKSAEPTMEDLIFGH